MYKLDLPVDMKESAAIERRRNRELQRQSRIFDSRVRTIGVSFVPEFRCCVRELSTGGSYTKAESPSDVFCC